MAALTVQAISRSGLTPSMTAAAAGGDTFPNAGNVFFMAINGSGSSMDLTFTTPATEDGLAISDRTVSVAAGATKLVGPFPKATYNSSGSVSVSYSDETSVTVAAISLTPVT